MGSQNYKIVILAAAAIGLVNIFRGLRFSLLTYASFLCPYRFKINDDEIGKDDLAAWACIRLDRLQTGYRLVHFFDTWGNPSDGALLVNIEKTLT